MRVIIRTVSYIRMVEILTDTNVPMIYEENMLKKLMNTYVKPDFLIIDDFLILSIITKEAETIFKILEYRSMDKSTIINFQLKLEE